MTDRIFIRDLEMWCIIGVNDDEREKEQKVIINIELECGLGRAGQTDNLADTLNYRSLNKRIMEAVASSRYFLVEALAEMIAGLCLEDKRVEAASVAVDKPGALRHVRSVAVQIRRTQE